MKSRYYVLIAFFSVLFFVVALFPASLLWRLMPQAMLASIPVNVTQVGGTIWQGFLVGNLRNAPVQTPAALSWKFKPWRLFMAQAATSLNLDNQDLKLTGVAHYGLFGKGVADMNGVVDSQLINPMLGDLGVNIGGTLQLKSTSLNFADDNKVKLATGELRWNGGPVNLQQGGSPQEIDFPAVKATLSQKDEGLLLKVVEQDEGQQLAELTLQGVIGGIVVYKRILRVAGQSNPADEDGILVQLQQPILLQ